MADNLEKELLAFYGDDLAGILDSLASGSNDAVEDLVQNILNRLTIDAEIFGANITKEVARLRSAGVSREVIGSLIGDDMATGGRIIGQYRNSVKEGIVEQINQSGRLGQLNKFPPDRELYQWTTVGGHKICQDCDARQGAIKTWLEWEREGLPGSGWSVCKGHCYCVLVPAGRLPERVDIVGTQTPKIAHKNITRQEADYLSNKFLSMAQTLEQSLTASCKKLARENKASLHGLDYRLKGKSSAMRKILTESVEEQISYQQMLRDDLGDLNRYTFLLDETAYVSQYDEIIKGLTADGYEVSKVKNYWDGDMYRGLNVNMRAPDGRYVEFQFNTKASQRAKDNFSHKWYEEYRELDTSPERKKVLKEKLITLWANESRPPGWNSILNYP